MSKNLLLEIGTEEMPANMMSGIVEQMHVLAGAKLDEARIAFEKWTFTPHREGWLLS